MSQSAPEQDDFKPPQTRLASARASKDALWLLAMTATVQPDRIMLSFDIRGLLPSAGRFRRSIDRSVGKINGEGGKA
jgi:hypothetical protein